MSDQPERLRQHPRDRFDSPQQLIDIGEVAAKLCAEPLSGRPNHRQETLYRHGPLTVALFVYEAGARMPQHVAEGVVTIHVLQGRLSISAEKQEHHLSAGQILVLAPRVEHDVRADEASRMLLTVCLEHRS